MSPARGVRAISTMPNIAKYVHLWWTQKSMGFHRVWVIKMMGYDRVDCKLKLPFYLMMSSACHKADGAHNLHEVTSIDKQVTTNKALTGFLYLQTESFELAHYI